MQGTMNLMAIHPSVTIHHSHPWAGREWRNGAAHLAAGQGGLGSLEVVVDQERPHEVCDGVPGTAPEGGRGRGEGVRKLGNRRGECGS